MDRTRGIRADLRHTKSRACVVEQSTTTRPLDAAAAAAAADDGGSYRNEFD